MCTCTYTTHLSLTPIPQFSRMSSKDSSSSHGTKRKLSAGAVKPPAKKKHYPKTVDSWKAEHLADYLTACEQPKALVDMVVAEDVGGDSIQELLIHDNTEIMKRLPIGQRKGAQQSLIDLSDPLFVHFMDLDKKGGFTVSTDDLSYALTDANKKSISKYATQSLLKSAGLPKSTTAVNFHGFKKVRPATTYR